MTTESDTDLPRDLPHERQIERKDGEVIFRLPCVDGIALIPVRGLRMDGPEKRFQAIRNLEWKIGDILLATYPKSGIYTQHFMFTIQYSFSQGLQKTTHVNKG